MPADTPDHAQWASLDESANPAAYVKFLDDSRAGMLPFIEAQPERFFGWMQIREGLHVLDVGSGTGVLLHTLARLLEPTGKVVGIDYSQTMVTEAQKRADLKGLSLEFKQMDAGAMTFSDNTFDRAMSNIVFQHLPDPEKSLAEMVRVTKPGGIISLNEQDWETFIVDASDPVLTRRLLNLFSDSIKNGWIGRQLYGMFVRAGLTNITVTPQAFRFDSAMFEVFKGSMEGPMSAAVVRGDVTQAELDVWMSDQDARQAAGAFFSAFTTYQVVGTKA